MEESETRTPSQRGSQTGLNKLEKELSNASIGKIEQESSKDESV